MQLWFVMRVVVLRLEYCTGQRWPVVKYVGRVSTLLWNEAEEVHGVIMVEPDVWRDRQLIHACGYTRLK